MLKFLYQFGINYDSVMYNNYFNLIDFYLFEITHFSFLAEIFDLPFENSVKLKIEAKCF